MTVALLSFELSCCLYFHTFMVAILSDPGTSLPPVILPACPFCHKSAFKRLGSHLPHCPERNGRDYSSFLSEKTIAKRREQSCKQFCPRCHKKFITFDSHLKRSATCRFVTASEIDPPSCGPPSSAASNDNLPSPVDPLPTDLSLSSTVSPQPPLSQCPDFVPKPKLQLPRSDEDWLKANAFFENELVPCVLRELSVDAKSTVLTEGVFSYFDVNFGTRKEKHRCRTRSNQLANQVKVARDLKNAARCELRQARTSAALSQEQISSIAKKFFDSVRSHNSLKRAHSQSQHKAECRTARHQCHKNLWKFTRKLLDGDGVSDIQPTFSKAEATSFFTSGYHSEPRSYTQPSWMPGAPGPVTEFNEDDISVDEIACAVKKSRSKSSPSPVDGIPYLVFKKCPALLVALHNIFNLCWTSSTVPSAWKLAAVRLIAKPSADIFSNQF